MDDVRTDFRGFVEEAARVLAGGHSGDGKVEFAAFARQARTLLLREIEPKLASLRANAELVARWSSAYDLLYQAGMRGWEDPVTELIRWALSPATHAPSALARQHECLHAFGWTGPIPTEPVEPRTQHQTAAGGFIDLVFDYPERAVVVEAKWFSDEHEAARTGEWQTVHYAKAARSELRGASDPLVVYLTPDGRPPRGIGRPVTHAHVALAIARALDCHQLTDPLDVELREAFRIVLGHIFRWDGPTDMTRLVLVVERITSGETLSIADLTAALDAHKFFCGALDEGS